MKGPSFSLIATAAVALFAMFAWSSLLGQSESDERSGGVITQTQPVEGDMLAAGRSVTVDARIEGDAAVAGNAVTVAEPVDGYVMAAGAEVVVDGAVRNDLWAAGRTVDVSAEIGDSARLAGATVTLRPEASIGGDAFVAGGTVEVRAPIDGTLELNAGQAVLASEIGGSVEARVDDLRLASGAVIHGDLIATGPNPPEVEPGAQVQGEVRHRPPAEEGSGFTGWLGRWAFGFLALLALGAATVGPSPRWSMRVSERIRDRFGASLLTGILAMVAVPVLVVFLAATVIGIPLAIVTLAFYVALVLLSAVFVAMRIGSWAMTRLGRPHASRMARLAVGALVLSLLASLPWIGWAAWIVVPVIGLGALLLERRDAYREPATVPG